MNTVICWRSRYRRFWPQCISVDTCLCKIRCQSVTIQENAEKAEQQIACYVLTGKSCMETRTATDSNDMTECSSDDKPITGVLGSMTSDNDRTIVDSITANVML